MLTITSRAATLFLLAILFGSGSISASVTEIIPWTRAAPETAGFDPAKLESLWQQLQDRETAAFLLIRRDQVVFERYAPDDNRTKPHYTASLAKAVVGGLSMMLATDDHCLSADDPVSRFLPSWSQDFRNAQVTLRMLATHTAGVEDAEAGAVPHEQLPGWKGTFWKRLAPPSDPFTLARDVASIVDWPGTRARYSNPGMGLLAYAMTASLQATTNKDLRALLKVRIFDPLGVPAAQWSVGYGADSQLDGLNLVANWGGAALSPDAAARIGELLLHEGRWGGNQLLSASAVHAATRHAGLPNNSGLCWWVNQEQSGKRHWNAAPLDAFWGAGAGHQFLLVIPSLDLVVVRFGQNLDRTLNFDDGLETHLVRPLMDALRSDRPDTHMPSPVIQRIAWAPPEKIVRKARGGDNWPLTWADDDDQYTAYGDGNGFEPGVLKKLSLGFCRVQGEPPQFTGLNVRSPTGEREGDGRRGLKASGIVMVKGVLYLWARNAGNAQLAWSSDHGKSWTWSPWKFSSSFGCPTFLNFGKNYQGARDGFVYMFSPDSDTAYEPGDRFVLARVPQEQITDRGAYEFFERLGPESQPMWTRAMERRGPVFERKGRCYRSSVTYNPGLHRYLWCQTLPGPDPRFQGGFAIYDSAEPWGPWTEAFYTDQWDLGPGESSSFPSKWISPDGQQLWLVFSGEDSFSVREARIETAAAPQLRPTPTERLRLIVETDAGGDPDDEQSLVRFLLYATEWDVEGIIATRPTAREGENWNPERTGLGIVRAQLNAYGQCYPHLIQHDPRYPAPARLMSRTVAGYDDREEGVALILAAVDSPDPRPVWFCNWGTDHGSAASNLKRALDRVQRERGSAAYAQFKKRLRLSSADAFGEHTTQIEPPWELWVDTFRPELEGKRWYHRFSALTAKAGGFDVQRDLRSAHGPLGALYPTNTTHLQKEGDTMSFLYLLPTGMNDPLHPGWGSWAGRYGPNLDFPGRAYYWANQVDAWRGQTNRDNTLARWSSDLQNDFRARLNWCVKDFKEANHRPRAVINGHSGQDILYFAHEPRLPLGERQRKLQPDTIELSAFGSSDPDGDELDYEWSIYSEAGSYPVTMPLLEQTTGVTTRMRLPEDLGERELHLILTVRDRGNPPLATYRRVIIRGAGP